MPAINLPIDGIISWIEQAYGHVVSTIQQTSSDYLVTLSNGRQLSVNANTGEITIVAEGQGSTSPTDPGTITPNEPFIPPAQSPLAQHPTVSTRGMDPFDITALKWLGSLVLLWIILTALTEYSPNTAMFGKAMAGLILLGALYYLGPGAISNIQNLWKAPGTAGPNPVPGA